MHIRLLAVGRLREPYTIAASQEFRTRLRPYHRLEEIDVRAEPGDDERRAVENESAGLLRHINPGEPVWLLDRTGTEIASEEVAARLDDLAVSGRSRLTLVVGGSFGVSSTLERRADFRWSLSRLTFLHEWARMIVLEQLYRAAKISRGEPYHH